MCAAERFQRSQAPLHIPQKEPLRLPVPGRIGGGQTSPVTTSWAAQLAAAVWANQATGGVPVILHRVTPISDGVLEVVFYGGADVTLFGLRLEREVLEAATGRLMGCSVEELAFDVVTLGIREPRARESFFPEDAGGVRWLPLSDWIDDIS